MVKPEAEVDEQGIPVPPTSERWIRLLLFSNMGSAIAVLILAAVVLVGAFALNDASGSVRRSSATIASIDCKAKVDAQWAAGVTTLIDDAVRDNPAITGHTRDLQRIAERYADCAVTKRG